MRCSPAMTTLLLLSVLLWACVGSESLARLDVPQSLPDAKDTISELDSDLGSRELPVVPDTSDAPSSDFHHSKCGDGECAGDEHCGVCPDDCPCPPWQSMCIVDHCSTCVSWCSHEGMECGQLDGCECGDCGCGEECEGGQCVFHACDGKLCGDDGCDGSCGTCSAGKVCDVAGQCQCVPECAGKECGDNGCGGNCGNCSAGETCEDGQCECVPACGGKECGDDSCGGNCGSCTAGETCENGQCECAPDCDGKACGDDGCGGSCGECALPYSCVSGQCAVELWPVECKGTNEPSYDDCHGLGFAGCCDNAGRVLWCDEGQLFCIDCAGAGKTCGWAPQAEFYNCNGQGEDPTGQAPAECAFCDPPCEQGFHCDAGSCVECVPHCSGKVCGTDLCGGNCGTCPLGTLCLSGECVCAPDCEGKECGDDACGGSCGACPPGVACVNNQCECIPDCTDKKCGDDGCGGSCGECPPEAPCISGQCSW